MTKYKCSYCGKEAVAFYITPDKKVIYLCEEHTDEFIFKGIAAYLPYLKELKKYKNQIKGVAKKKELPVL